MFHESLSLILRSFYWALYEKEFAENVNISVHYQIFKGLIRTLINENVIIDYRPSIKSSFRNTSFMKYRHDLRTISILLLQSDNLASRTASKCENCPTELIGLIALFHFFQHKLLSTFLCELWETCHDLSIKKVPEIKTFHILSGVVD